ncbi:LysM domain-containing protein [Apibacter muscae]|uniref:LysM peptidoglycan-binding domain-containing protein n=1 Tax=Apibacter muscae TaxID=2509004 RepID=UPI0011AC1AA1|nr:LysM domain-containing protein [Apibacter muscae]TWP31055.1 LysM domain-containing protein [Apibacter muscae]
MEYEKYKVSRGDTLESIAKELNLSVAQLREFHNRHCELPYLLGSGKIPSSVKEILYLPLQEIEEQAQHKITNQSFYQLRLRHPTAEQIYQVKIKFFEEGKENSLSYIIKILWLEKNTIKIHREELFIDGKEPNFLVDELATQISSVLYPMEFYLDAQGCFYKVKNLSQIKERWNQLKPQIEKLYKGNCVTKYLYNFQKILFQPYLFNKAMKQEVFLTAYFTHLYGQYNTRGEVEEMLIRFPVIPTLAPVQYVIKNRIEWLEEAKQKLIKIERKGELADPRSLNNFLNAMDIPLKKDTTNEHEEEKAKGAYRSNYFLHPGTGIIDSLYLECNLETERNKKIYLTASRLNQDPPLNKTIKEEGIIEIGGPRAQSPQRQNFFE